MYQLQDLISNISMGQGGRDDLKCSALKLFGLNVYTVDDKHDSVEKIHLRANFCMPEELIKGLVQCFGPEIVFDYGVLDYFFSPVVILFIVNIIYLLFIIYRILGVKRDGMKNS